LFGRTLPAEIFVSAKLQWLVVLCIIAINANGDTVRLEDEKLTFTLPPGWVAIPARVLAQHIADTQKTLTKPYPVYIKYGYQKQGADWFSYPYLLIN
jgi:hypothetical protein